MLTHADVVDELQNMKTTLLVYLQAKVKAEDWHGVADAAMDLREIDAKLSVLQTLPRHA